MHRSGLFMLALRVERFAPLEEFICRMADMSDYVRSSRPSNGFDRILIPGEYEHEQRQRRAREGVEIPEAVWQDICAIAERLNHREGGMTISIPDHLERTS